MFFRIALPGARRILVDHIAWCNRARAALESAVGRRPAHAAGRRDAGRGDGVHARLRDPVRRRLRRRAACRPTTSCRASRSSSTSRSRSSRRSRKFRAGRRIWARLARERYGAQDPRSWRFKFHAQTSGVDLTRQQPLNNIARVTVQAMAGIFGGLQSLHTDAYDEALSCPTQFGARIAVATQNILREEAHLTDVIDPLGGSLLRRDADRRDGGGDRSRSMADVERGRRHVPRGRVGPRAAADRRIGAALPGARRQRRADGRRRQRVPGRRGRRARVPRCRSRTRARCARTSTRFARVEGAALGRTRSRRRSTRLARARARTHGGQRVRRRSSRPPRPAARTARSAATLRRELGFGHRSTWSDRSLPTRIDAPRRRAAQRSAPAIARRSRARSARSRTARRPRDALAAALARARRTRARRRHHRRAGRRQVDADRRAGARARWRAASASPSSRSIRRARSPAARCSATASAWATRRATDAVFIRSLASRGHLGGLARTTRARRRRARCRGLRHGHRRDRRRRPVRRRDRAARRHAASSSARRASATTCRRSRPASSRSPTCWSSARATCRTPSAPRATCRTCCGCARARAGWRVPRARHDRDDRRGRGRARRRARRARGRGGRRAAPEGDVAGQRPGRRRSREFAGARRRSSGTTRSSSSTRGRGTRRCA